MGGVEVGVGEGVGEVGVVWVGCGVAGDGVGEGGVGLEDVGVGVGGQAAVGGCGLAGEEAGQGGGGGGGQADEGDVFAGVQGQVQVVQESGTGLGEGHVVEFHEGWGGGWGVVGVAA